MVLVLNFFTARIICWKTGAGVIFLNYSAAVKLQAIGGVIPVFSNYRLSSPELKVGAPTIICDLIGYPSRAMKKKALSRTLTFC
jgi:hypothetical protein